MASPSTRGKPHSADRVHVACVGKQDGTVLGAEILEVEIRPRVVTAIRFLGEEVGGEHVDRGAGEARSEDDAARGGLE